MMPKGLAVCRRIPCLCEACLYQLNHPWDPSVKDPRNQPMFQNNPDCEFRSVMGNLNNWHFITVEPATKKNSRGERVPDEDPEQVQRLRQEALTSIAMKTSMEIKVDGFGAINADGEDAPDGFYLVQWKGKPYTLQAPTKVECCGDGDRSGAAEIPAGTLVCKAIYWDRIGQAPGWYEPPLSSPSKPATTYLFWLNHVL
jgi:hypothetical protein